MADPGRERLREELGRLRIRASISQRKMGGYLGGSQMKAARIESGETLPSVQDTVRWLDAVAAVPGVLAAGDRVRLLDLAEAVQMTARGWADLRGAAGHVQGSIAKREQASILIRNAQPQIVPGLLQTPETARVVLGMGRSRDVEAAVAARVERQRLLYEPGRRFQFVITEQSLRTPMGGPEMAAAQRVRVGSLAQLAAVDVAVLPADRVVGPLWHNFVLWTPAGDGDVWVSVELIDAEHEVHGPEPVSYYEQMWSRLWSAAITDPAEVDRFVRSIR